MSNEQLMWIVFAVLMGIMILVDLGRNQKAHVVSFKESVILSGIWVALALIFNAGVYFELGGTKALEFFTGYVIEKSLSVDNLFVFLMIFSYFKVAQAHQTRVIKWGILGALVFRAIFIFTGLELLKAFHWMFYVFGALLLYTAFKMALGGEDRFEPDKSWIVRGARRIFPLTRKVHGDWFFSRRQGMIMASPLFLVLLIIETSDVIFALDSIPAIFAVTLDPFIVFTSNLFAIMGLRALYFLLANVMTMFAYLKIGVSFVLAFVGVKMILGALGLHMPIHFSLLVIVSSLALSILASVFFKDRQTKKQVARERE